MAAKRKKKIEEPDLKGFKHFKLLNSILERLHDTACKRDRAGNRTLHFDQYTALILLYFFNPIVTSLRGIQQTSELKRSRRNWVARGLRLARFPKPRGCSMPTCFVAS